MRSGWLPLTAWGCALVAVAVLGATVFGLDVLPTLLLAGAGAAGIAVGLGVAAGARRGTPAGVPRVEVRGSVATSVVAVGVAVALVGAASAGPAFFWPGIGLVVLGLGGLVRERLAERRILRERRP
jgi:hypothetical protein